MKIIATEWHPKKSMTADFPLEGGVDMDEDVARFFTDRDAKLSFRRGDKTYWYQANLDGKVKRFQHLARNIHDRMGAWRKVMEKFTE